MAEQHQRRILGITIHRRTLLIAGGIFVVVLGAVAFSIAFMNRHATPTSTTTVQHVAKTVTQPTTFYNVLDGTPVADEATARQFPVAVMVENLPEVRPQSGLSAASVVYETLAEGGATRFMAVFSGPKKLAKIGPVRSSRPYYISWLLEYNALYGHAGGSPDALRDIVSQHVHDFNGIGSAAKYFYRDHGIAAPHNLFTNSDLVNRALRDLNLTTIATTFRPWLFKDDRALDARPASGQFVRIQFSGRAFETEWRYDHDTNTYLRFNAGVVHKDALTDAQLSAKNVIVQLIPRVLDVGEKGRLTLDVHGTGKALIFVDGGFNTGTWHKANGTDRTIFTYDSGKEVELNRGATWVEVVPNTQKVEYSTPL